MRCQIEIKSFLRLILFLRNNATTTDKEKLDIPLAFYLRLIGGSKLTTIGCVGS